MVFAGRRKVIFVNGCFWHGHIGCRHARLPKTRIGYWRNKRKANRVRDRKEIAELEGSGWKVLTVWQCELKDQNTLEKKLHDFLEHN
jgi:DNA mismatch endonuclease (patch repair protein)